MKVRRGYIQLSNEGAYSGRVYFEIGDRRKPTCSFISCINSTYSSVLEVREFEEGSDLMELAEGLFREVVQRDSLRRKASQSQKSLEGTEAKVRLLATTLHGKIFDELMARNITDDSE